MFITLTACQGNKFYKAYEGEPQPSNEIAIIQVPAAFNLMYVDDQPYRGSWLSDTTTIHTLPGQHQFIFKYKIFWEISSSDAEKVESQPFALSFNTEAGNTFVIETTPIKTLEEAKAYAKNPAVKVTNQTIGEAVSFDYKTQLQDKGFVASFVTSVTSPPAATAAPAEATTTTSNTTDATANSNVAEQTEANEALDKLKHWWQNADTKQRQEFMEWVYQQKPASTADASTTASLTENAAGQDQASEALDKLKHWWDKTGTNQRQEFMQWVYKQ
jgi:uncharacterized protein YccT (UPF0319 family)